MSEGSQGEGWWVASDGQWYAPHLHPEHRPAPPSDASVVQSATNSDPEIEASIERSAIAVATAQQCVNGHEMPESHVFCSVCGSKRSEVPPQTSAPVPDNLMDIQDWWAKHFVLVVAAVLVVFATLGIGIAVSVGSGSGGGGQSQSYQDGWNTALDPTQSVDCNNWTAPNGDNQTQWVQGCNDASNAANNALSGGTTPTTYLGG